MRAFGEVRGWSQSTQYSFTYVSFVKKEGPCFIDLWVDFG